MPERAWMLLAYGDDRAYGGNDGYSDSQDHYSYDNRVANSRQLSAGDLVVMADKSGKGGAPRITGIARVQAVEPGAASKEVGHCPVCGKTRFKPRKNRTPLYRCDNGHEFDEQVIEVVPIKGLVARFGGTYRDARDAMTVAELRAAQVHKGDGSSIRQLDLERLQRFIRWDADLQAVAKPGDYPDPKAAALVDAAAKPLAKALTEERYPGALVVPQDQVNPGFDIAVYKGDQLIRYVEVKATVTRPGGFYMSDYQLEFSKRNADRYSLLVLVGLDIAAGTADAHWFDGAVDGHVELRAVQWRGSLG